MEYAPAGTDDWTDVTAEKIEGLAPGTYLVHYKETPTTLPSAAQELVVGPYVEPTDPASPTDPTDPAGPTDPASPTDPTVPSGSGDSPSPQTAAPAVTPAAPFAAATLPKTFDVAPVAFAAPAAIAGLAAMAMGRRKRR